MSDAETLSPLTNEQVVRQRQKVKDERDEFNRIANEMLAEYDAKIGEFDIELLRRLNNQGSDSFQAAGCTVYKHKDITPIAADWQTIYRWIKKHDAFDMLERRLKKTFINEYIERHKEKPPGVSTVEKFEAKVRRNPTKKEKAYNG